jgi:hypothetical protein
MAPTPISRLRSGSVDWKVVITIPGDSRLWFVDVKFDRDRTFTVRGGTDDDSVRCHGDVRLNVIHDEDLLLYKHEGLSDDEEAKRLLRMLFRAWYAWYEQE